MANKLVTTRRANENNHTSDSQVLEPAWWWRGLTALLSQRAFFSLIDVRRVSSAYVLDSGGCCRRERKNHIGSEITVTPYIDSGKGDIGSKSRESPSPDLVRAGSRG
eukprot:1139723-Pelagomonas_calceolata.AAC.2